MRRIFLVLLVLALAGVIVGCGGDAATTTTESVTTTLAPTTTTMEVTTTTALAGATDITVPLSGAESVPPVQTQASGQITFTLDVVSGGMGYKLEVTNITDVTAAHIHLGAKGANGPVVVPLFNGPPKTGSFSGVLAEGTITPADLTGELQGQGLPGMLTAMQGAGLYANVHTQANPDGEIRGQLELPAGFDSSVLGGMMGGAGLGTTTTGDDANDDMGTTSTSGS